MSLATVLIISASKNAFMGFLLCSTSLHWLTEQVNPRSRSNPQGRKPRKRVPLHNCNAEANALWMAASSVNTQVSTQPIEARNENP